MEKIGRRVEIVEGKLPEGKPDVIGAVVGIANFDWAASGSTILPGAIVEHLTSHGGNFGTPGQTKLTAFLRAGAAGASGTVMEPLADHFKFPNPMIHLFYAKGCSLAEAFFQSVGTPYQLMVAGDGLARPFATFAEVVAEVPPSPWQGTVRIACASHTELWIDGRRVQAGQTLSVDTTALEDGYHDVRLVTVATDSAPS